jgi:nitrogen fixation NifU-like protein
MSDLSDLYQEVILDHNRSPRNHGRPEGTNRESEGYNPLCGDRLTVYLRMNGDRVEDVGFEGSGCAISQASASVMTTVVKGKTRAEVEALVDRFQKLVTGKTEPDASVEDLGDSIAMAGVSQFPSRVKCATLGWHTAAAALHKTDEPVSTE